MRKTSAAAGAALSGMFVLATVTVLPTAAAQTGQTAQTPPAGQSAASDPAPPTKKTITGVWHLNKELSSDPTGAADTVPAGSGGQGGSSGRSGGGSGGGRRGGGGGGYGGGGGGYGGRSGGGSTGGASMTQNQIIQIRDVMRQVAHPPDAVTIVTDEKTVTFTDFDGAVRKFTTDGKKEKIELGTEQVETVTKWENATLTQELTVGPLKVTRTWHVTEQGNEIVETIKAEGAGGRGSAAGTTLKFIFDRAG